jgi:aarF domain-containing kinase
MASRDLRRLFDGIALVARESARRTSARDVLKSALLAATDLAGLTRGTPRTPEPPPGAVPCPASETSRPSSSSSVVYFSHDEAATSTQDPPLEQQQPPAQECLQAARSPEIDNIATAASVLAEPDAAAAARPEPEVAPPSPSPSPSASPAAPSPSPAPMEKRRRPRERRVPSTPFTRALGSVYHAMLPCQLKECIICSILIYMHQSELEEMMSELCCFLVM